MVKQIAVYAEGPTEWYAVYQLHKRGILAQADLVGDSDRNNIGAWLKQPSEMHGAWESPPSDWSGILLICDQEQKGSPADVADEIARDKFDSVTGYDNLFQDKSIDKVDVVLHVATAESPGGNRDFDGYIIQLLDQMGANAIEAWFDENNRAKKLAPAYLADYFRKKGVQAEIIHNIGTEGIPTMMEKSQWNILRAKTLIYAYITALQVGKSHVWFTEKMVKIAPEDILQQVFSPLIAAWNLLAQGGQK